LVFKIKLVIKVLSIVSSIPIMDKFIRAIYPGSFDPVTFGHIDMIERAAQLFDEFIVAVGENPQKDYLFNMEERVNLLRESLQDLDNLENVKVDYFEGLLVNYCKKMEATIILRGMRAITDFEREFQMALANMDLAPKIETLFMVTKPRSMPISLSLVREIAYHKGDVSQYTTAIVGRALEEKFSQD
jgi:pantetheine-phosphate adenylyltransferase